MKIQKQQKRILIVDDDQSILRLFTRILEKAGYKVDTAETGRETAEKITQNSYDLAIVDVRLPDTSGIDLIAEIHAVHPDMIKIVLTGLPSIEDGARALDRGVDAYLVKPIKTEELLNVIEENLKKHTPNR